jgi:PAS domain S-box-containing protein
VVLAGFGYLAGMNGLNAGFRYALGLIGGIMTASVLFRESEHVERSSGWTLRLMGAAFLCYGFATGLVVPKASFFPASLLNHDSFFDAAGIPIQVFRALCAVASAIGVWFLFRAGNQKDERSVFSPWMIPVCCLVTLILGFFAVNWRGQTADQDQRNKLLFHAVSIARAIDPERIGHLYFSSDDLENPHFLHIRQQLRVYGKALGLPSIYSIAERNGHIVFGPENIPEGSPMASPPGTVYEQPKPEDWQALKTIRVYVVGPVTDEYGTFISAAAPVVDQRTGKVLLLVGLDIQVDVFKHVVSHERLIAIFYVLGLVIIFLGGVGLLRWRATLPLIRQKRFRYIEAGITALIGLMLTGIVVGLFQEELKRSRKDIFVQLAQGEAGEILQAFNNIRNYELEGLVRFFEGSEEVTPEEFKVWAEPQMKISFAQTIGWVDELKGQEGRAQYSLRYIWAQSTEAVFSNDVLEVGAEYREAFEEALKARLPFAIDRLDLVNGKKDPDLIYMFYPVSKYKTGSNGDRISQASLSGFSFVGLHFSDLLKKALSDVADEIGSSRVVEGMDVYALKEDGSIEWVASSEEDMIRPEEGYSSDALKDGKYYISPLFILDKTYVLVIRPIADVIRPPLLLVVGGSLIGLLLSGALTFFVGFLSNRRALLEEEVLARTNELLESIKFNRALLDNSAVGIVLANAERTMLEVNGRLCEMLGFEERELRGRKSRLIHISEESYEAFSKQYHHLKQAGSAGIEYPFRCKDGREIWCFSSGTALDTRDLNKGVIWTLMDVTERRKAEEALRHSKVRFDHIAELSREVLWEVDSEGLYTYVNHVVTMVYGYAPEELVGKKYFYDLHPFEGREEFKRKALAVFDRRDSFRGMVNQVETKSGQVIWVSTNGVPMMTLSGELLGYRGGDHDITERKMEEEVRAFHAQEIERERANLSVIFESAQVGLLLVNSKGEVGRINNILATLVGQSAEDLINRRPGEALCCIHPLDTGERYGETRNYPGCPIRALLGDVLAGNKPIRGRELNRELVLNGERRNVWLDINASPLVVDNETCVLLSIMDVTERKNLELSLVKARQEAEDADQAKSDFLANMSHEIRTPMNGILGFGHLLRKTQLNEKQQYFVNTIVSSGQLLMSIINDILDLSKVSSGRMTLEELPFDLWQILTDAARIIEPQVQAPNVALVVHIDPALTGKFVGDPVRLRQVMINLLGNAAKFTSLGEVTLTARWDGTTGNKEKIFLSVKDTGIGISEEKRDAIFDAFVQADMSTTRKFGGTGLGLSISKAIVGIMGGTLDVRSKPGEGSEFSFLVELARFNAADTSDARDVAASADVSLKDVRVLVAEDNAANQGLIREFGYILGCQMEFVENGKDAVEKLRQGGYDMCFMDLQMPVMGGEDAVVIIRSEISKDLPIIALTAAAMSGEKERLLKLGMTDYLSKPVLFESLRDKIIRYKEV